MDDNDAWSHRELQDHEYPEPDDLDDDSPDTTPCPHCGAEIYEESEQCPRCGEYVSSSSRLWSNRSWWWVLLGVLGIAAVVLSCMMV